MIHKVTKKFFTKKIVCPRVCTVCNEKKYSHCKCYETRLKTIKLNPNVKTALCKSCKKYGHLNCICWNRI